MPKKGSMKRGVIDLRAQRCLLMARRSWRTEVRKWLSATVIAGVTGQDSQR